MMPLPHRRLTSLMARYNGSSILIDCGEGTQIAIKEKGWTEEYQNGANQRGVKKSSEGETYNVVLKNYNSTLAAICKLLPDERVGGDELMDFIGR